MTGRTPFTFASTLWLAGNRRSDTLARLLGKLSVGGIASPVAFLGGREAGGHP